MNKNYKLKYINLSIKIKNEEKLKINKKVPRFFKILFIYTQKKFLKVQ